MIFSKPSTKRPKNPFCTSNITDTHLFVGRVEELLFLAGKMSGCQPTSVNVVGPRLLGKSSLLYHFSQTWGRWVEGPQRFLVAYVCLLLHKPSTEAEFYKILAHALRDLPAVKAITPLYATLGLLTGGSNEFAAILDELNQRGLLPVFCLDAFEKLLERREALNKDFYDRLRGLMRTNRLMLIIASRELLKVYGAMYQLDSQFFNMAQAYHLKEFNATDVAELLMLPGSDAPALNPTSRQLASEWGGTHPYWLQTAASWLFEAQQNGKGTDWAKRSFDEERQRIGVETESSQPCSLRRFLRTVFYDFPRKIGRLAPLIGRTMGELTEWIVGCLFIVLALGALFRFTPITTLYDFIIKILFPSAP